MGEFNASSGRGKTLAVALQDIFTVKDFTIAIGSALVGYIDFVYLRKRS